MPDQHFGIMTARPELEKPAVAEQALVTPTQGVEKRSSN